MTTRRDARSARRYASAALKAFGAAAVLMGSADPATRAALAQYLS